MKPLSIEELKALEVGDWVYTMTADKKYGAYGRVCEKFDDENFRVETIESYIVDPYDTYGTKWIAYKNKEQAEAKGEIVERELWEQKFNALGNDVWCIIYNENEETKIIKERCLSATHDGIFTIPLTRKEKENFYKDGFWFIDKEEAERRLAELKGEKV